MSEDNVTLDTTGSLALYILPTQLRVNQTYSLVSSSVSLVVLHLVPLVLLTLLNTLTFVKIKRSSNKLRVTNRRRRDLDIASALSVIVLVFIMCHGAKFLINLVEFCEVLRGETLQHICLFLFVLIRVPRQRLGNVFVEQFHGGI